MLQLNTYIEYYFLRLRGLKLVVKSIFFSLLSVKCLGVFLFYFLYSCHWGYLAIRKHYFLSLVATPTLFCF